MNANLEKQKNYLESPHIVIWRLLYLIEDNSIILKSPTVSEDTSFHRKIYYEIEKLGKNIKIHSKNKKYKNVKIDDIIGWKIFILVNIKLVWKTKGVFFYEFGKRMETADIEKQEKAFVMVGMVTKTESLNKREMQINETDMNLAKRLWVNQIKTDGSFHFNTTGKIFGLGFGPKYSIDKTTYLLIGQFVGGRLFLKKISQSSFC